MRLDNRDICSVATGLAKFFTFLAQTQPYGRLSPLPADGQCLSLLAENPAPVLQSALKELFRQKFMPLPASLTEKPPVILVTPALLGLAVILNNLTVLQQQGYSPDSDNRITLYDRALFAILPVPLKVSDILSFDLLTSSYVQILRSRIDGVNLGRLETDLIKKSPFTLLKSLDLILPQPLGRLASDYLPDWPLTESECDSAQWWLAVESILAQPELACHLHSCWLELPENRLSSLGLGLLFEGLRDRGEYDQLILKFFEAYEFIQVVVKTVPERGVEPEGFSLLSLIESLLSASAADFASRRQNQLGNEYFMKFRALLEIVAERGGIPGEFRHLSHDFCFKRLMPLVSLATIIGGHRNKHDSAINVGRVNFS